MNLFVKTPSIVPIVLRSCTWNMPRDAKTMYLTFDDGPIPEATPYVLDILKSFNIKATFFCIGKNIDSYSSIYQRIVDEDHSVGNHTYNHKNGWKTKTIDYLEDVQACSKCLNSRLFRPPYGKLKLPQLRRISKTHEIIMWDVLSYDWVQTLSPKAVLQNVNRNATNGSIIVFHDSIKAKKNLEYTLPRFIETQLQKGFSFDKIKSINLI